MVINGNGVPPTPLLFLDELINEVQLSYIGDKLDLLGGVVQQFGDISLNNLMPQLITGGGLISFPQACRYKGVKAGALKVNIKLVACPVDLDEVDFEIWKNGVKFTVRVNRNRTVKYGGITIALFDIIKAEFYGKLLPSKYVDDYVELKPKGA